MNIIKNFKNTSLFIMLGMIYVFIEIIYRSIVDISSITLTQSLVAFIMGGLSAIVIGYLNEFKYVKLKMLVQSLIGVVIILVIEYFAGVIFNGDYSIWDYRSLPLNVNGQICLPFGIAWFAMTPFIAWIDDHIRHNLFNEESNSTMLTYYKRLFTWK